MRSPARAADPSPEGLEELAGRLAGRFADRGITRYGVEGAIRRVRAPAWSPSPGRRRDPGRAYR